MKIHIAGFPVRVGNKGRQLCAWCGEVLFDVDYANGTPVFNRIRDFWRVASNEDGTPGEGPRPWEIGDLIAVEGNGKWVVPHDNGGPLPLQCCASQRPPLRQVRDDG